ncbi:Os10g0379610 [Oryza sativa Japonica Group]|uniref:Os10g0379610 protein n=1 Tax=Oryza sativa subsp. japonica TaxID=39947 RepID=A0A0P0XTJ9_ORYSJ|nr:Os10g0379610 [Oryza sativa Japonica Group]
MERSWESSKIIGVINLGNRFFLSTLNFSSFSPQPLLSSPRSALSSALIQAVTRASGKWIQRKRAMERRIHHRQDEFSLTSTDSASGDLCPPLPPSALPSAGLRMAMQGFAVTTRSSGDEALADPAAAAIHRQSSSVGTGTRNNGTVVSYRNPRE